MNSISRESSLKIVRMALICAEILGKDRVGTTDCEFDMIFSKLVVRRGASGLVSEQSGEFRIRHDFVFLGGQTQYYAGAGIELTYHCQRNPEPDDSTIKSNKPHLSSFVKNEAEASRLLCSVVGLPP